MPDHSAIEVQAEEVSQTARIAELYASRAEVVWTHPAGLSPAGEVAIRWLRDAPHHGVEGFASQLQAVDEHLALLVPHAGPAAQSDELAISGADVSQWIGGSRGRPERLSARQARCALEACIADAMATLVQQLSHQPRTEMILRDDDGRYDTPDRLWQGRAGVLSSALLSRLTAAAEMGEESLQTWLQGRLPSSDQYAALLDAAKTYGALCEEGGWPAIAVTRYRRGARWKDHEAIRALQERLRVEGFFTTEVNGVYDEVMKESVRRYQSTRHLRANGRYDKAVSLELNIPCEKRLESLHLNLRRWRQTARTSEGTFVEVNLAAQEVRFVSEGEERLRKRTVVGSGKWFWSRKHKRRIYPKKSPLLTDKIKKVIVNPSWTIPGSIVKQEILPRVEKDPTYLERKGYIVKKSKNGHDIYVQPPGPNNTLGEVKLIFPNAEAIYLHDTNNRYLFRTARRDLSHGCIRVQDALDFATALMADAHEKQDKHFNPRALHRISRRTRTVVFKLDEPIPVFLEYYTASVGPEGMVRFHPDVYEYDLEVAVGGPVPRRLPKALRR
ncbi:MAG: L,D-transpeptidase family protein [Myxococcota bacterium]